jgi:hypothetical protein
MRSKLVQIYVAVQAEAYVYCVVFSPLHIDLSNEELVEFIPLSLCGLLSSFLRI